jgi:hypothetical protein
VVFVKVADADSAYHKYHNRMLDGKLLWGVHPLISPCTSPPDFPQHLPPSPHLISPSTHLPPCWLSLAPYIPPPYVWTNPNFRIFISRSTNEVHSGIGKPWCGEDSRGHKVWFRDNISTVILLHTSCSRLALGQLLRFLSSILFLPVTISNSTECYTTQKSISIVFCVSVIRHDSSLSKYRKQKQSPLEILKMAHVQGVMASIYDTCWVTNHDG